MTDVRARAFRDFRFPAEVILWAVRWYRSRTSTARSSTPSGTRALEQANLRHVPSLEQASHGACHGKGGHELAEQALALRVQLAVRGPANIVDRVVGDRLLDDCHVAARSSRSA
jgi:hypothetical protein